MRPTKNADTLRAWLQKPKERAFELVLYYEGTLIETWSREAAEQSSGAENVLASAQAHCDMIDKTCMFTAQWRDPDHVSLASKLVTCQPDDEVDSTGGATVAQGLALSYKAQANTQRMLQSMLDPLISGFGKVIESQNRQITTMQVEIESLRARLHGTTLAAVGNAPENEEVVRLKLKALGNLAELGPDVGRLALAAITKVLKLDSGDEAASGGGTVQ
jgi:hypothetical protein